MLDAARIRHKGLRELVLTGKTKKVSAQWIKRLQRRLQTLDAAVSPDELLLPGFDFHELSGDRKGTFSIRVTGNWRITFKWDEDGPYDVDLEDYH